MCELFHGTPGRESVFVMQLSLLLFCYLVHAKFDFDNCSSNDVKTLNRDTSLCTKVTSDCLEEMDIGGISAACLKELSGKCVDHLKKKSLEEIAKHKNAAIPDRANLIKRLFETINMEKERFEPLRRSMAKDADVMNEFFRIFKDDGDKQAIMLAPEYVKDFPAGACTHFRERTITLMDSSARAKLSAACVGNIPVDAFKGFKGDSLRELDPKAFNGLKAPQVEAAEKAALEAISSAQAREFGSSASVPTKRSDKKSFVQEHACSGLKKRWGDLKFPEDVKKALEGRCHAVWNGANLLSASHGLLIGIIITALFLI